MSRQKLSPLVKWGIFGLFAFAILLGAAISMGLYLMMPVTQTEQSTEGPREAQEDVEGLQEDNQGE